MSQFVVTRRALAEAFAEWERQYRENPDEFSKDWHEASVPEITYGDAAANFLLKILRSRGAVASLAPDTTPARPLPPVADNTVREPDPA